GIRDLIVTGVQTCALPISSSGARSHKSPRRDKVRGPTMRTRLLILLGVALVACGGAVAAGARSDRTAASLVPHLPALPPAGRLRSEERRVGEGCARCPAPE